MDSELDAVRKAALERAAKSSSWEDIEKAATVAKALAEAEKNASDTRNAHQQLRLQSISSLATFLIPIVSLLALFGTIYFQDRQLKETRQQNSYQQETTRDQNEDSQWRDLLTTLRGSPDTFDSDVTVALRLRSFFASVRYGDQARDISIRLMGRLTSVDGFKDLFGIVFAEINLDSFERILDVGRSLNATRINIEAECSNLSAQYKLPNADYGLCTLGIPVSEMNKVINAPFPQRGIQLRQALNGVYAEMLFISQSIAPYLRANYAVGAQAHQLDLSSINFFNIDLSKVDFSDAKLDNTIFWNVSFDGADLRSRSYGGARFNASNWWDAQVIDQGLLNNLIQYQHPFYLANAVYTVPPEPTQAHYNERIAQLCQPPRPACAAQNLRFRSPATGN